MRPPCTNSSGRIHASAAPSDTSNAPQEVPKRTGSHGKRSMQHADYHNLETKRRKEGAESAAKVQERATQLVQQLAAPHGQDAPQETSGTLAKAEDRQNTYNMCIDTKPWATGRDRAVHATKSTAGLPMRTGHYESHASCRESFAPPSLENSRGDSPVEQTNSDPSVRSGASPVNAADQDSEAVSGQQQCRARSQSPPAGQLEFSSTQKFKRDSQCNESMGAIKDRQMNEQTLQNHPQNSPAHGKRYSYLLPTYCCEHNHLCPGLCLCYVALHCNLLSQMVCLYLRGELNVLASAYAVCYLVYKIAALG